MELQNRPEQAAEPLLEKGSEGTGSQAMPRNPVYGTRPPAEVGALETEEMAYVACLFGHRHS